MLDEGDPAPDFTLPADNGDEVTLSDLGGRPVVVYFYPRDDTPGCTVEACGFRDAMPELEDRDAVVLGISDDDVDSHADFKAKHDLNFPLLADEEGRVGDAYGVYVEKQMYGNTFMGMQRATFLVDADGQIARVWPTVDPEGHADEVLAALEDL